MGELQKPVGKYQGRGREFRNAYREAKAYYLKMDINKGPVFRIRNEIKQWDPMSSSIFKSVLEEIFRKLTCERKGVNIGGCHHGEERKGWGVH